MNTAASIAIQAKPAIKTPAKPPASAFRPGSPQAGHYARVIRELSKVVGFEAADEILLGARLRIDDYLIAFIYDDEFNPNELAVYVDMGKPGGGDLALAYGVMLKINFELDAGSRGVISMHPDTGHLFYSFRYPLNAQASGQSLLDTLIRFIGDFALDAEAVAG
ncbi:hypothetical protein D0T25_24305 [Duganella sp. BJB488]|uniref:hypothetical protein n=1 Tax=unclassified Duganella TaxID=2636909 RepID=UPI000E343AB6|nr:MULTISPECIES: hypothetical protein [unclassified Duganella]RFP09332.1 hypothetical protein D0T23_26880 [Duganella sp. BJB475]RFP13220.1 hypothetical protein D0T26_23315 [Duganella sp. BJB489]RFP17205.1 hypothetical protein D0T25_24305 [Duganella sp. BJB488]RFP25368.1 hypothetical protein D0T21_27910 [Duganella sp. BJB476]RFP31575.1 hypothetical protein D0T24_24410 [Duganella sp. BJB480]